MAADGFFDRGQDTHAVNHDSLDDCYFSDAGVYQRAHAVAEQTWLWQTARRFTLQAVWQGALYAADHHDFAEPDRQLGLAHHLINSVNPLM